MRNMISYFLLIAICQGTLHGQTLSDSTIHFLNSFYNHYIAYCCYDDGCSEYFRFLEKCNIIGAACTETNRINLMEEMCTKTLLEKIEYLQKSYALDYDPFINSQFCPPGIYNFSISQTTSPNWYQMKYEDLDEEYHVVYLNVESEAGTYKISNIRDYHDGGYSEIIKSE